MIRKIRSARLILDCLRMAHCFPAEAAAWLSSREVRYSSVLGTPETPDDAHLPEYLLYRRADPAIDAALASHGQSRTVLARLHDRAGPNLRVVLASNGFLFGGSYAGDRFPLRERGSRHLASEIIHGAPLPELRALCENPDLPNGLYGSMIGLWKPGKADVGEERFRHIVRFLADNPRIATAREESRERHYLDGMADYQYNRFFADAWRLAETVPVTPEWAEALAHLYRHLHKPFPCLHDVGGTIARWNGQVGQYEADRFREVRASLCANFVKPTLDELRSDDPARRDAFLMTFDPTVPEFCDLDWNEFPALDRHWHLSVRQNMKVWASPVGRDTFRRMLWKASADDNDITAIGLFDEQKERLEAMHPDWFTEPEEAPEPVVDLPGRIDQLRSEVQRLVDAMGARRGAWLVAGCLFVAGLLLGHWL